MSIVTESKGRSGNVVSGMSVTETKVKVHEYVPQIQRHHVIVGRIFDEGSRSTWSQQIYVPFMPDEVIVRSVNYSDIESQRISTYILQCTNLDLPLAALTNASSFCPLTIFNIQGRSINTNWQFQLQDVEGNALTEPKGQLAVLLEFVKH